MEGSAVLQPQICDLYCAWVCSCMCVCALIASDRLGNYLSPTSQQWGWDRGALRGHGPDRTW